MEACRAQRPEFVNEPPDPGSGLTLVTAAIALWNTVYLEGAVQASDLRGQPIDPALLKYLSPLGWEHINLIGDYQWSGKKPAPGRRRLELLLKEQANHSSATLRMNTATHTD